MSVYYCYSPVCLSASQFLYTRIHPLLLCLCIITILQSVYLLPSFYIPCCYVCVLSLFYCPCLLVSLDVYYPPCCLVCLLFIVMLLFCVNVNSFNLAKHITPAAHQYSCWVNIDLKSIRKCYSKQHM